MAKKEKKVLPDDIENSTASAEEIMRKYDRESATRIWTGAWGVLPVYSSVLTALSVLVFIVWVKNIRIRKVATVSGLEAFGEDD